VAFQSLWGNVMRKVLNYDAGGHGLHFIECGCERKIFAGETERSSTLQNFGSHPDDARTSNDKD